MGGARSDAIEPTDDRRVEVDLAAVGGPDGGGHLVGFCVLQQEPGGTGVQRGVNLLLLDEGGEGDTTSDSG